MSNEHRFFAARVRVETVAASFRDAQPSPWLFETASSAFRAVLSEFPVLRCYAAERLCASLSAHRDPSNRVQEVVNPLVEFDEIAGLIDSLLSGLSVSDVALAACANFLFWGLRDLLASSVYEFTLYIAVNFATSPRFGIFFLCGLKCLLRNDGDAHLENNEVRDLVYRCNVALQKFDEASLPPPWLESRSLLQELHDTKLREERISKGFSGKPVNRDDSIGEVTASLSLLSFYSPEREIRANEKPVHCPPRSAWSNRIRVPLDFLMAMYAARPSFVLKCVRKTKDVDTAASAIIAEFSTSDVNDIRFATIKCMFLTDIAEEWTRRITLNALPEELLSVLKTTEDSISVSLALTPLQYRTTLNIYLKTLVRPLSNRHACIADLKLVVKTLFLSAVYDNSDIADVLAEYLSVVPPYYLQEILKGVFTSPKLDVTILLKTCSVIKRLGSTSASMREAFLRSLSPSKWHFTDVYKSVLRTQLSVGDEEVEKQNGSSSAQTQTQALVSIIVALCESTVFLAHRSSGKRMRYIKLDALRQMEQHMTWLFLKLPLSPPFPQLGKAWAQLHVCISSVYAQRHHSSGIRVLPASMDQESSNVHACSCGALRIADFVSRRLLPITIRSCICKAPLWFCPSLPKLSSWVSWEISYESCVVAPQELASTSVSQNEGALSSALTDNRLWVRWTYGLHAKAFGGIESVHNNIVELIFCGFLKSRVIWSATLSSELSLTLAHLPSNLKALCRSLAASSSFRSIPWLYGCLKSILDGQQSTETTTVCTLMKACVESFLASLPKRLLYPLCDDQSVLFSEMRNAEHCLRIVLEGKHELESWPTNFPLLSCYSAHLGNMAHERGHSLHAFPLVAVLRIYTKAKDCAFSKSVNVEVLPITKERILASFFLLDYEEASESP